MLIAPAWSTATLRLATQLLLTNESKRGGDCLFSTIAACAHLADLFKSKVRYGSSTPR
jgi:hypothetical protein